MDECKPLGDGSGDVDKKAAKESEHIFSIDTESLKWNIQHTYKKPRRGGGVCDECLGE